MSDAQVDYWVKKLDSYAVGGWADKPSLFAQAARKYFPATGRVLELGAGVGQDGAWFASDGFEVTLADLTELPLTQQQKVAKTMVLDLAQPLPANLGTFDVIYSHLALHYFSLERTKQLFAEIYEHLPKGGIFAFLVNSVHDPEVSGGEEIEPNYRAIRGINKRFFDLSLTQELTASYEVLLLDDNGTSYKDQKDGLTHLIRFVGKK